MTLGLPVGTEDATTLIAAHLAPLGRAMLVLDGCEAVLDGAASLAASLLAACPALTLVVTSRVPLAVEAERVIAIAAFPPPRQGTWRELAATDQVRLLVDRVRRSGGELDVDEATAPFVAELCRRCGGLPLAIELAGAQLAGMSVPDLLDHLPGLAADGADRVRAITESSYALLAPDEATVFRRLAVLDGPVALPFLREVVAGGVIAPVRLVRILRELTARGLSPWTAPARAGATTRTTTCTGRPGRCSRRRERPQRPRPASRTPYRPSSPPRPRRRPPLTWRRSAR